jgi:N,N-dimethylformamidase
MPGLVGYTDRLSAAPGDTIRFMVSSEHDRYESRLVRLIHGDTNPAGPGFKQVLVPSAIDGVRAGRRQELRSGSSASLPVPAGALGPGFTFAVFVQPTAPGGREQVIASRGRPFDGDGWALAISKAGMLEAVIGQAGTAVRITADVRLPRWGWCFVALTVKGGRVSIGYVPWGDPGSARAVVRQSAATGGKRIVDDADTIVLAASRLGDGLGRHFDGRLDRPRLIGRPLSDAALLALATAPDDISGFGARLLGAWDFSLDMATDRLSDISGNERHGTTSNLPTRAVTGHDFSGDETDWRQRSSEYGAIHFHRDDLEDAGWTADFELTIPPNLPSGIYAAWLQAGPDEDYLPFTVRPPRGTTRSRIAVLMSTVTYVTYANFTDIGRDAWQEGVYRGDALAQPFADPTLSRDVYGYIAEHSLYGLYDIHEDGSGVCYGSMLQPILNMRPKFRYRTLAAPARFPADLYQVDWLEHKGIEVDYITDHDLIAEGVDLLRPYSVVLSSSHHEYWTGPMLDALRTYLDGGGRFMYLGGNGLFGVVSIDPDRPHVVELRRWGTGWPFEMPPAERHHSMTGEPGGTWRNRGRGPHTIVGVGTAGAGFDRGSPYQRQPDSDDPRVAFIFEGIEDQLIGDEPNLQVRWGAAGYEFDRVDVELGSPASTLRLASSVRFNASHKSMVDDELYFTQGRDGVHVGDPQVPGRPHRFARADMAYLEYPNGGAVFSAGSICWRGSLSAHDYDGTVSRVTENVLRRFADPDWRRPEA